MPDPRLSRILIVDDEAAQMRALCNTLKDHGYETTGVTKGEDALETLRETKFELLLADLMMPGLDGLALLRAAQQSDPDLVGIIMTVLARALTVRRLRIENAALETSLRQRTVELEVANKELDAFSFSVAHD